MNSCTWESKLTRMSVDQNHFYNSKALKENKDMSMGGGRTENKKNKLCNVTTIEGWLQQWRMHQLQLHESSRETWK